MGIAYVPFSEGSCKGGVSPRWAHSLLGTWPNGYVALGARRRILARLRIRRTRWINRPVGKNWGSSCLILLALLAPLLSLVFKIVIFVELVKAAMAFQQVFVPVPFFVFIILHVSWGFDVVACSFLPCLGIVPWLLGRDIRHVRLGTWR